MTKIIILSVLTLAFSGASLCALAVVHYEVEGIFGSWVLMLIFYTLITIIVLNT